MCGRLAAKDRQEYRSSQGLPRWFLPACLLWMP
jgi:hypothetical protein